MEKLLQRAAFRKVWFEQVTVSAVCHIIADETRIAHLSYARGIRGRE